MLKAQRELLRLRAVSPSPAAPLTDEDLAIFSTRMVRREFEFFVKAAYLEYHVFFGGEMGKAIHQHMEVLDDSQTQSGR